MKRSLFIISVLASFIIEIVLVALFLVRAPKYSLDTVEVNEAVKSVTKSFYSLNSYENTTSLDYVVLDNSENVLYKTRQGLSESKNKAIEHQDTILDIEINGKTEGKIIIFNDAIASFQKQKQNLIIALSIVIALQCGICIGYFYYVKIFVIKPFGKLKGFAERVAGGNLDIPLEMDRKNIFGAFTESFDIMRAELKKARIAEAQANQSKKELVAKLSHDIKTPVASIKAIAEVGIAVSTVEKDEKNYACIIGKADQINTLVTNLFTATLEELQQLTVAPSNIESKQIKTMLEKADYLHRADIPDLPECLIYADALRLQQVFDNIFANSYKYAKTDISVTALLCRDHMEITIEDFGGGVKEEELPILKEKFKRGSNSVNTEGAGLGLYISDYFMKEMHGELLVSNGAHGIKVTVNLMLSGEI